MAATTTDRDTTSYEGYRQNYPVKGATSIPGGVIVCADSTGYAVNGSDTAGLTYLGVSVAPADNSSGSAGDIDVIVDRTPRRVFEFEASGLAITDVGATLYVSDNQTVAKTTSNSVEVGKLSHFSSATVAPVRHNPLA